MGYDGTRWWSQPRPQRAYSRRSLLRAATVGVPVAAGAGLLARGGLLIADLRERERNVGKMAANTGRAEELHGVSANGASAAVEVPEEISIPLPPPADDSVAVGSAEGRPIIGRLRIPSVEVDAPIVPVSLVRKGDSESWETANRAVGHHQNSALPGTPAGNAVFSGHISSIREGDVFRRLPDVRVGDELRVTIGHTFTYRVTDKLVVRPADTWVMDQTEKHIATFITCVPDGVYSHRLVVVAEPLEA